MRPAARYSQLPPSTIVRGALSAGHWIVQVAPGAHESEHEPVQRMWHVEPLTHETLELLPTVTLHSEPSPQSMLHESPHAPEHSLSMGQSSEQLLPAQPPSPMSQLLPASQTQLVPLHVGGSLPPQATSTQDKARASAAPRRLETSFMVRDHRKRRARCQPCEPAHARASECPGIAQTAKGSAQRMSRRPPPTASHIRGMASASRRGHRRSRPTKEAIMDLPLHPKLVHLPMALAVIMPLLSLGLLVTWITRVLPRRTWLIAIVLQGLLLGSGIAALRSGEADEERVEAIVPEPAIEAHEAAATTFVVGSAVVLAIALAAAVIRNERAARGVAALAVAGTAIVLLFGYRTGDAGGRLVYQHGAASSFAGPGAPAVAPPPRGDHDD